MFLSGYYQNYYKKYPDKPPTHSLTMPIGKPIQGTLKIGLACLLHMHQAVGNLVKNAIEHSHQETEITVSALATNESVQIMVSNVGELVPAYAIDKLFDRFYSLQNSKGQKGSGIGLSFVKEIAKLHNGEIKINNLGINTVQSTITLKANQETLK